MNVWERPLRRAGARFAATALVAAALGSPVLVAIPSPAMAAPLGTVTLTARSGTVTSTPIFAGATTSAPCPPTYGANALLRVGPPGGPFTNLAKPLTAGGYDKAKVSFTPNRSFATALGRNPGNGDWWVVVECFSVQTGRHAERFVTPIIVSGTTWRLGSSGKPALAVPPDDASTSPGTVAPSPPSTPATAAGAATSPPAGGTFDPAPVAARDEGSGDATSIAVIAALVLVAGAIGGLLAVRRRRALPDLPAVRWPDEAETATPPKSPPAKAANAADGVAAKKSARPTAARSGSVTTPKPEGQTARATKRN